VKLNNWFQTNFKYSGTGYAKFDSPVGLLKGQCSGLCKEDGNLEIELKVEETEESPNPFAIVNGDLGKCIELKFETDEGIFSSDNLVVSGSSYGDEYIVSFVPLISKFQSKNTQKTKYWVMPLSNLITEFLETSRSLDDHPLTNNKLQKILFTFNQEIALIEPIENYKQKEDDLKKGITNRLITALAIGTLNNQLHLLDQLENWYPIDIIMILSLASGGIIGSPWREIRSEDGELISRIHINSYGSSFKKSRGAIRETFHRGCTGKLLNKALSSPEFGKSNLRVLIRHLMDSNAGPTLEDKFMPLCIAFDMLMNIYKLKEVLLHKLNSDLQNKIGGIIDSGELEINAISESPKITAQEKDLIYELSGRLKEIKTSRSGFGRGLISLLRKYEFPDSEILDDYYEKLPGKRKWRHVVSRFRNIIIHDGFIDFKGNKKERIHVSKIIFHLQDVLTRMIFKMIDYDDLYQPVTIPYPVVDYKVDWVNKHGDAVKLGFNEPF